MRKSAETPGALETSAALIRGGTPTWIPSAGLSMGSAFAGVEAVLVRRIEPEHVRTGMIVVYARHGIWVAHRVVGVLGSGPELRFMMKGDGVSAYDNPNVEASECVGAVIGLEGNGVRRMLGQWDRALGRLKAVAGVLRVTLSGRLRSHPCRRLRHDDRA
jgi:hypothetical protein